MKKRRKVKRIKTRSQIENYKVEKQKGRKVENRNEEKYESRKVEK